MPVHRKALAAVAAVWATAAVACAAPDDAAGSAPPPSPTATGPVARRTVTATTPPQVRRPAAAPATAAPFRLTVTELRLQDLDNAAVLGVAATAPVDGALVAAVDAARGALERFLTDQLVDPAQRYTAGPIDRLLAPAAVALADDAARAGLGQLPLDVAEVATGPATAVADAVVRGEVVVTVALTYEALLTARLADGRTGPVSQRGTVVLSPGPAGWQATAVEVTTDAADLLGGGA